MNVAKISTIFMLVSRGEHVQASWRAAQLERSPVSRPHEALVTIYDFLPVGAP